MLRCVIESENAGHMTGPSHWSNGRDATARQVRKGEWKLDDKYNPVVQIRGAAV
jgi:hypothetical protein